MNWRVVLRRVRHQLVQWCVGKRVCVCLFCRRWVYAHQPVTFYCSSTKQFSRVHIECMNAERLEVLERELPKYSSIITYEHSRVWGELCRLRTQLQERSDT